MITVMIPALNEEKNIKSTVMNVINAAKKAGNVKTEIFVVNDGSTDRTEEIVLALMKKYSFIQLIRNERNRGIGYSLKEVLARAKYPQFLIVPGDNDLSLDLLMNTLKNHEKAELIMTYFLNREIRGRKRNVISVLFGTIYMVTFGIFVQYINGPCIYPTAKMKELHLRSNRFSIVVEITIKLLRMGCTYYEISGYMQKGLAGSTSLSLKNFIEVVRIYFHLIFEIYLNRRKVFNNKPVRVY